MMLLGKGGAMIELQDIKLNSPDTARDVYPIYKQFRADGGIVWSRKHKAWVVSNFDYARNILNNPASSVEKLSPFTATASGDLKNKAAQMQQIMNHWLPFLDPPAHTRMRKILQRGFMPRSVECHEAALRASICGILDEIAGRQEIEFLADFAAEVPARAITYLYGLPVSEVPRIHSWADGIAEFVLGSSKPDRYDNSLAMMQEMHSYFMNIVKEGTPPVQSNDDAGAGSLMNLLLESREEPDGLNDEEIVATLILVLFAAPETTANMLLNAMLNLVKQPGALAALAAHPENIPTALEETVRFDGPVPAVVRVAKETMVVGETTINQGERIFVLLKSANRDELQFNRPETLDLGRGRCQHFGFGSGIHLCVGAPLARLEARIAFEELLKRYSAIKMVEQEIVWRDELLAHSPKALRLQLTPRIV